MKETQNTISAPHAYIPAQTSVSTINGNGGHIARHTPLSSLYDVMIEEIDSGYMARVLFWPHEIIIASTYENALEQAQAVVLRHLSRAKFVTISVDQQTVAAQRETVSDKQADTDDEIKSKNPLSPFFGMYKDHPEDFEEFQADIAHYRDEIDRELGMGKYMDDDAGAEPSEVADVEEEF